MDCVRLCSVYCKRDVADKGKAHSYQQPQMVDQEDIAEYTNYVRVLYRIQLCHVKLV